MKIYPIHTNSMAFKAKNKDKDDSQVEEVAALGGGALGGTAVHKLGQLNKVATKTGGTIKNVGDIVNRVPINAKNYQEGLLMSFKKFFKNIHMEKILTKPAGKLFGVVGGAVSLGSAAYGITEAAGTYSGLLINNK